jgi:hypothetical protein
VPAWNRQETTLVLLLALLLLSAAISAGYPC